MENKRILFLRGEIGSGKTTLLKKYLSPMIHMAGGFVTRLVTVDGKMQGIEVLPARDYLSKSPEDKTLIFSFKDGKPCFSPELLHEYFGTVIPPVLFL